MLKVFHENGLGLFAHPVQKFTGKVRSQLPSLKVDTEANKVEALLVVLQLGARFGNAALRVSTNSINNPYDQLSIKICETWLQKKHIENFIRLYPDSDSPPLRPLLQATNIAFSSPLGTGIRHDVGPWYAVRTVYVANIPQDLYDQIVLNFPPYTPQATSPCETCTQKPCITACPAKAIAHGTPANLQACSQFRIGNESVCAKRCHARLACPVGIKSRYSDAQLDYHYGVSLQSIKSYFA